MKIYSFCHIHLLDARLGSAISIPSKPTTLTPLIQGETEAMLLYKLGIRYHKELIKRLAKIVGEA